MCRCSASCSSFDRGPFERDPVTASDSACKGLLMQEFQCSRSLQSSVLRFAIRPSKCLSRQPACSGLLSRVQVLWARTRPFGAAASSRDAGFCPVRGDSDTHLIGNSRTGRVPKLMSASAQSAGICMRLRRRGRSVAGGECRTTNN